MYRINSWNERTETDFTDLNSIGSGLFDEYKKYSYAGGLQLMYSEPEGDEDDDDYDCIYDSTNAKPVATMNFRFFDITSITNDGIDIVNTANMYDPDVYDGMCAVVNVDILDEYDIDANEDKMLSDHTDVYVETLYVCSAFRNKGIGNMLMNNLRNILKVHFNIEPRFVFLVPCPQEYNGDMWENTGDEEMLEIMEKFCCKHNFQKLGDTKFYGRNFLLDSIKEV